MNWRFKILKMIGTPGVDLPLSRGYIHVHNHNIQTISSLKPLGKSKPNFMWSIVRKGQRKGTSRQRSGKGSLYKWQRSHDQDGRRGYAQQKPLKVVFFRTRRPMKHQAMKLFEVCINIEP